MSYTGFGFIELLFIFIRLIPILAWIVLAIIALVQLRSYELPETARAIWAALILVIPLFGAIAFWIVQPGKRLT
jgi:hypothetical protein